MVGGPHHATDHFWGRCPTPPSAQPHSTGMAVSTAPCSLWAPPVPSAQKKGPCGTPFIACQAWGLPQRFWHLPNLLPPSPLGTAARVQRRTQAPG